MLTDAQVKVLTNDIKVRNVIHMLQQDLQRLTEAIVEHRAQKADDRCIEDDDQLYAALKDNIKCDRRVGDKAAMLHNCKRFIENRCQEGGWPTYAELEAKLHAAELQVHDNQTLREDYEALVAENAHRDSVVAECRAAVETYKEAAHRDEETIKELKARIAGPVERSETFKEVRDERDQALKTVALLADTLKEVQGKLAKVFEVVTQPLNFTNPDQMVQVVDMVRGLVAK